MSLLEKFFYKFGLLIANNSILVSILSLLLSLILSFGIILIDFENEPQKLWVSEYSTTNIEQLNFNKQFGAFFRINQAILKAKYAKDENTDLFTKEYLAEIYDIQNKIEDTQIVDKYYIHYNIKDLCFKPIKNKSCMITSPMEYWKMDINKLHDTKDVKQTALCLNDVNSEDLPCMDRNGIPIIPETVFGPQECVNKNEKKTDCNLCKIKTKALKNNIYFNSISEIWEKEAFIKTIQEFNNKDDNYFLNKKIIPLTIDFMSERSIPDNLKELNSSNVLVVALSYIIMFLYIAICMGEFNIRGTKVLLALGGIIVVLLSFVISVSIVSILGIKLSLISAEVVPFLILAIGVDNMFIITGTKSRINYKYNKNKGLNHFNKYPNNTSDNNYLSIEILIAKTLKEAGPSITVASFCEFLAFLVGYLTNIPALQSFCLAAGFAVFIDYILQITMFVSFVVLDEKRIRANRIDVLPFIVIHRNTDSLNKNSSTKSKLYTIRTSIINNFVNFLNKKLVQIIFCIIYALLIATGISGMIFLTLGLDQRVSVLKNSYIYNYFNSQIDLVDVGPPAYFVLSGLDYSNKESLKNLDELIQEAAQLESVVPPIYSWVKDFEKFNTRDAEWTSACNPNIEEISTLSTDFQVQEMLKITVDTDCCKKYGLCGETYQMDININNKGFIESTRLRFQHNALTSQKVYIDSLVETKNKVKSYSNRQEHIINTSNNNNNIKKNSININNSLFSFDNIYSYSLFYVYFDQYLLIKGVWIENLLIALGVIFIASQITASVKTALLITLIVLSQIICLIGLLYASNILPGFIIEINAVSVVNVVMACGLSVEFVVHIIIFFNKKQASNYTDNLKYAFDSVGLSVFIGIVTTKFLGVVVLGFAPSEIFRLYYFRMFICLIIVGFFHGFIMLPILLKYINASKYKQKTITT